MTTEAQPGKKSDTRTPFGPRPIGAVVPAVTRPAFRSRSPAAASLFADWPAIVGPALASMAEPRRFAAGTLTLGCTGPAALELQHLAGALIDRLNTHTGRPLVQRLRFVQEVRTTRGESPNAAVRAKPRLEPVSIDGLPDGPLREALAALGGWVRGDPA